MTVSTAMALIEMIEGEKQAVIKKFKDAGKDEVELTWYEVNNLLHTVDRYLRVLKKEMGNAEFDFHCE